MYKIKNLLCRLGVLFFCCNISALSTIEIKKMGMVMSCSLISGVIAYYTLPYSIQRTNRDALMNIKNTKKKLQDIQEQYERNLINGFEAKKLYNAHIRYVEKNLEILSQNNFRGIPPYRPLAYGRYTKNILQKHDHDLYSESLNHTGRFVATYIFPYIIQEKTLRLFLSLDLGLVSGLISIRYLYF